MPHIVEKNTTQQFRSISNTKEIAKIKVKITSDNLETYQCWVEF